MQEPGVWRWSRDHLQVCRIIESETHWGDNFCRVWLTGNDSVVRVVADTLEPIDDPTPETSDRIKYVTAAARVSEAIEHDTLLAPISAAVVPLPHQIKALTLPRR